MQFLKNLWSRINGNKSIIIGYALYILGIDSVVDYFNADFLSMINEALKWLGGGALIHHGMKGNFKIDTK